MTNPTFAIVDVETSGGNVNTCRIIEVAVVVHNGRRVINSYSSLVNPERKIDPFVCALTGIHDHMVKDAPLFEEIAEDLMQLTEDRVFVGHNVRFDYGVIRNEFKRVRRKFQRKQICTDKLSRKYFPHQTSYSLGRLCKELDIPVDNRHRALGDATATACLLEKMLFNERKELIHHELKDSLSDNLLPPNLSRQKFENLPDETGVYYFHNEKGQIIYVGKSTNIKKRIQSHFSSDIKEDRFQEMKAQVHDISFELTGSELVAMLLESEEIKRFMPAFNRAQRRKKYRYAIYRYRDEHGLYNLKVELIHSNAQPILKCTSKRMAERSLASVFQQFEIRWKYSASRVYAETELASTAIRQFNRHLEAILKKFNFTQPSFMVFDYGRDPGEDAVVWVENGVYKGFGYVNRDLVSNNLREIQDYIKTYRDNPDVHRIIKSWLRKKNKRKRMISYDPKEIGFSD